MATRVITARYGNFLNPSNRLRSSQSIIWKGLQVCKSTIYKGSFKIIGDGNATQVWTENWIPCMLDPASSALNLFAITQNLKVTDLILLHPRRWNTLAIDQIFNRQVADAIKSITLNQQATKDMITWLPNSLGTHSVKSYYLLDQQHRFLDSNSGFWKKTLEIESPQGI